MPVSRRKGSGPVAVTLSTFARNLNVETAFTVLAVARTLKSQGKDVVELEIGDSPFESTASAKAAGEQAIRENQSHYCPSPKAIFLNSPHNPTAGHLGRQSIWLSPTPRPCDTLR